MKQMADTILIMTGVIAVTDVDYILKPCPFCGSMEIRIEKCTARVRCKNCYATSGMISKLVNQGVSEDKAPIVAWNTRSYEKSE